MTQPGPSLAVALQKETWHWLLARPVYYLYWKQRSLLMKFVELMEALCR